MPDGTRAIPYAEKFADGGYACSSPSSLESIPAYGICLGYHAIEIPFVLKA